MTAPKLLFVDDDIPSGMLDGYLAELRKSYEVVWTERATEVAPTLAKHADVRAIVLDIAMAVPPGADARALDAGQLTGLWVLREIKNVVDERNTGVLVLTNRLPSRDVKPLLDDEPARYPAPRLLRLCKKLETPATYLPHLVGRMVAEIDATAQKR